MYGVPLVLHLHQEFWKLSFLHLLQRRHRLRLAVVFVLLGVLLLIGLIGLVFWRRKPARVARRTEHRVVTRGLLSAGAITDKPAEIGLAPLQVRDIADAGGLDTLADALAKAMDKRTASKRQRLVSRRGTGVVEVTMESAQPEEATG